MPRTRVKKHKPSYAESVKDLSDDALFCQAFVFHRCKPYVPPPGLFGKPEYGYREVQICECGTIRHALFSRVTGERLSPGWKYIHEDAYKVEGPVDRQDMRREYFRRKRANGR